MITLFSRIINIGFDQNNFKLCAIMRITSCIASLSSFTLTAVAIIVLNIFGISRVNIFHIVHNIACTIYSRVPSSELLAHDTGSGARR